MNLLLLIIAVAVSGYLGHAVSYIATTLTGEEPKRKKFLCLVGMVTGILISFGLWAPVLIL